MTLEASIQNLADAINELAKSNLTLAAAGYRTAVAVETIPGTRDPNILTPDEAPKRGRGRPPGSTKKPEPEQDSPEVIAERAAAVAARVAAVAAEATPAPAPAPAPAPSESGAVQLSKKMLQETLIDIVKKHGRDACGALCRKHGGPNLSALPEDVYPALYADARELLAKDAA